MHKCTFSALTPKHLHRTASYKCLQGAKIFCHNPWTNQAGNRLFSISRVHCSETHAAQAELAVTRHEALTLQHKAENILGPVFKVGEKPPDIPRTVETVKFWRDVLSDAFENLSTAAERPARIVVFSVDESSGARDLVMALLEEPLSSNQTQQDTLRNRWQNADLSANLTISTKPAESPSSIHLSSSYMQQFSIPIEIIELCFSTPLSTTLNSHPPGCLFKADVPLIVFNPLTTPLSTLKYLNFPSHAIFVASGNPHLNSTPLQQTIQNQLAPQFPLETNSPDNQQRLLFVDFSRALSAIQTFRSNPTSPLAIQQYLNDFTGSGISRVTQTIRDVVDSGANTSSPIAFLRNRTAVIQLHDVLNAFRSNVQDVKRSLDDIREGISRLTRKMEEAKIRVPGEILGPITEAGKENGNAKDIVGESLRLASKEMKVVLEKLNWWKAMWHIDEIGGIVGAAVDRVWCTDLKKQLILQTGRLLSLQAELTRSAMTLVNYQTPTLAPPSPLTKTPSNQTPLFTARILKNTLSQLHSSPSSTLTPSTLTTPLTKRKSQLLAYPTTRLQVKAQHLLLQMSAGVTVGSGFTWAGWMGYLAQTVGESGTGVWGTVGMGMDPATGMGLGLLGAVYIVRRVVGKWEKEKKRWWADWERVGQGLDRDLKAKIDDVMKEKVVVVADTACQGLNELCDKRQEEVDKTRDDVADLQSELQNIISRTHI